MHYRVGLLKFEKSFFLPYPALFQQVGFTAVSYNERDLCSYLALYDFWSTPTHGYNSRLSFTTFMFPHVIFLLDFPYTHLLCLKTLKAFWVHGLLSIVAPSRLKMISWWSGTTSYAFINICQSQEQATNGLHRFLVLLSWLLSFAPSVCIVLCSGSGYCSSARLLRTCSSRYLVISFVQTLVRLNQRIFLDNWVWYERPILLEGHLKRTFCMCVLSNCSSCDVVLICSNKKNVTEWSPNPTSQREQSDH